MTGVFKPEAIATPPRAHVHNPRGHSWFLKLADPWDEVLGIGDSPCMVWALAGVPAQVHRNLAWSQEIEGDLGMTKDAPEGYSPGCPSSGSTQIRNRGFERGQSPEKAAHPPWSHHHTGRIH